MAVTRPRFWSLVLATALVESTERIQFKLAVLVYKCLHGTALSYLADELEYTADFEAQRRLRSASSLSLNVRRTRLSTVGDQAFPVAAPVLKAVCPNMSRPHPLCLFSEVASRLSSSGVPSHDFYHNFYSATACEVTVVIFGHLNRSFYLLTYLLTYLLQAYLLLCTI